MAGKISMQMHKALALYAGGAQISDAARKARVSSRGLRYAIKRKAEKKALDKRK